MSTVAWTPSFTLPPAIEFENNTENETQTDIPVVLSKVVNINRLFWPTLFTTLIIVTNCLSLAAFGMEKRLRTYNNYFIINLSILDFLVGLNLIISVVHTHIGYYPLSQVFCKILGGLGQAVTSSSNFVVVIICADRHRATYDPINHYMTRSKRKAIFVNSLAWIAALAFWMPFVTVWEFIDHFDNGRHCVRRFTHNPWAYVVNITVMFYLPLVLIFVLNLRIFRKIQKTVGGKNVRKTFQGNDVANTIGNTSAMGGNMREFSTSSITAPNDIHVDSVKMKRVSMSLSKMHGHNKFLKDFEHAVKRESAAETRKAQRTLLFIVLSFVISWLPHSIIRLIYAIEPVLIVPGLPRSARLFFSWMTFGNSLLNPISYAITQPLLRTTLRNMMSRRCR
ncbi:muscarinic acetylcholine receptor M2-like [Diadema antillarum]|uniref:muscarinic acetylcholine receptor M2-like n=1 Tax=Diadema antillarum TaxID=105358 RepID=UPI003A8A2FF6